MPLLAILPELLPGLDLSAHSPPPPTPRDCFIPPQNSHASPTPILAY